MPSRAYTSFLHEPIDVEASEVEEVSMPSRAYTSFLLSTTVGDDGLLKLMCQCPLGLIPHFYVSSPLKELENSSIMCQCPLGLIPHFYEEEE